MSGRRSKLTLERVLGLTAYSNAGVSINNLTGEVAYPAGCVVVMYNFRRDKQVRYYRVEKQVSAIAFSPDGKLLAIAEKGHAPAITVWEVDSGQLKAELKKHKYGIAALAISSDGQYLMSTGLVHDKKLFVWQIPTQQVIGTAEVDAKLHAIDYSCDGDCFVTVGEAHVQFWKHDGPKYHTTGNFIDGIPELRPTLAIMSRLSDATFVGVGCAPKEKTFSITLDGFLCCFGGVTMERLVSVEANHGFALSVTPDYVAVGGASSIVRLFDPATLEYKQTLPFPAHASSMELPDNLLMPPDPKSFPAVVALRIAGAHIVIIYADHSLVVLDIPKREVVRSYLFHQSAVTDIAIFGSIAGLDARGRIQYERLLPASGVPIPDGAFVTVSEDNSVRYWHLEYLKKHKYPHPWTHSHGNDLLGMTYIGTPHCSFDTVPDVHTPKDTSSSASLNGLECVSAYGLAKLAVGDKLGAIHVVDLSWPLKTPTILYSRHSSALLSMAYSPQGYLATGSRDRTIHVYAAHGECIKKLENHSGAVQKVQFTQDGKRLVSGGADHSVVFTQVGEDRIFRYNSMPVTGGKLHDLAVVGNDLVVTATHARVDVHTLISNKPVSSHAIGEHHRISVAPGGSLLGLSGATVDKCVYVADFSSGEILAKAAGHGDTITSIKFSLDGRRLISTSSDGCIFVWRLSEDLQAMYKSKIPPLSTPLVQEAPPLPVQPMQPEFLPPPAPPAPPRMQSGKTLQINTTPTVAPVQPTFQPLETLKTKMGAMSESVQKSWQDGKQAVPGPMAPLELEDWMKTREVPRFDNNHPPQPSSIEWQTDRVPDWAKTVKPLHKQEATPTPIDAKGKWAAQGVVDSIAMVESSSSSSDSDSEGEDSQILYIKQSNGSLQSIEIPIKRPSETILTDVPLSHISNSVTLSQAREIHSKKKRQQDAANAVAEMQAKLGQLGILKRKDDNPLAMDVGINFASEYYNDTHPPALNTNSIVEHQEKFIESTPSLTQVNDVFTGTRKEPSTIVVDIPQGQAIESMPPTLSSTEVPLTSLSHFITGYASFNHSSNDTGKSSSESCESNVSLSHHNYAQELEPVNASLDAAPTNLSLSTFISGHHPSQNVSGPHSVNSSIDLVPVNASLSAFVAGSLKIPQSSISEVQQSIDLTPVNTSLSMFVAGHSDESIKHKEPITLVQDSIDLTPTNVSLSTFVSGHDEHKPQQSIDFTPTNMSLSTFVSGHCTESIKSSPNAQTVQNSIDLTPTNMSLSTFVSGHHEELSPKAQPMQNSIDLTPTNVSLSSFMTGYGHAPAKSIEPLSQPSSASQGSIDLTPTNVSLSTFISGNQHSNSTALFQRSLDLTPVNESLGGFVSGHVNIPRTIVQESIELTPTNISLSSFIAGEQAPQETLQPVDQSIDLTPTNVSLGHFISGFQPSASLDIPTNVSLSAFISGYEDTFQVAPLSTLDTTQDSIAQDNVCKSISPHCHESSDSSQNEISQAEPIYQEMYVSVANTLDHFTQLSKVNHNDAAALEIAELARQLQNKIAQYSTSKPSFQAS